ncbi:MAG: Uma2 family endonuclease [Roseiflexaceae bacterium]
MEFDSNLQISASGWSEAEYLSLSARTNRLVELSEGCIEVLPAATRSHQRILLFLYRLLFGLIETRGRGSVLAAPLPVRLWEGKIREPDLIVMLAEHRDREHEAYFDGADLVVEVVNPDDPERDLTVKRAEYAQAGIPEYWIVDPKAATITVLRLDGEHYTEHRRGGRGETVASALLDGVQVDVSAVLDAAQG